MLFYTGRRSPYPYSTDWLQEFDDSALAVSLYGAPFPLVDVTVISDDEIMNHRSMAALTLLQSTFTVATLPTCWTGWPPP